MKKRWLLLLLISLGLNLGLGLRLLRTPDAGAPPPEAGSRPGPGWQRRAGADPAAWERYLDRRLERLARHLDLRPEQVEALAALQREFGRELRQRRLELDEARRDLGGVLGSGELAGTGLRAALDTMSARQAALDSLTVEALVRELQVLDPEQRPGYMDRLPGRSGRGHGPGRGAGRGHQGGDGQGRR